MRSVISARSSISRKTEFRIITTIEKQDKQQRVVKRAAQPEAKTFLQALPQKTRALAAATKHIKGLSVVEMHVENDLVWSPFIVGPTLDEEFSAALLQRDGETLVRLFKEVIGYIDALKTIHGKPSNEVAQIFGDFGGAKEFELIECGYIDFNLDNFIRSDTGVKLIDPEFKYDTGVPKQYVITRLLVSYLVRYSHISSTMASKEFPVLDIGDNSFIPKVLWDTFKDRFNDLESSAKAESNFQSHYSYSQGVEILVKPVSEWRVHTKSVFQDVSVQIEELRNQLKGTLENQKSLQAELDSTKTTLIRIRNHWLVKNGARVKRVVRRVLP